MAKAEGDERRASVVIPAHNEEHALPRLLVSLLEQELKALHLEVIVVVNGRGCCTHVCFRLRRVRTSTRHP
jgi:cellulose synthase/poly-beta-1,6-N-acetylglucosamine synthase-like glycosyltransferase